MKNKKGLAFLFASAAILFIASIYGYGSKSRKKISISQAIAMSPSDLRAEIREAQIKCEDAPWHRRVEACDRLQALKDQLYNPEDY